MCSYCDGTEARLFDTTKYDYVFPQTVAREAHIINTLPPPPHPLRTIVSLEGDKICEATLQSKSKKGAMLLSVATPNRWTNIN
jgi:hypothetical protein